MRMKERTLVQKLLFKMSTDDKPNKIENNLILELHVPGDEPNSMWLVRKIISSGYKKPIIACSSSSEYRETLMRAGATHQTNKFQAVKKIKSLLDL